MSAICGGYVEVIRRIVACPTEGRRRRMVVVVPDSPYYAGTLTCCGCGDSWSEGFRMERPFRRGWRKDAKARARHHWDNPYRMTDAERRAWLADWLELPQERSVVDVDTKGLT